MPRPPAKSTSRGASSTKRVAGQRPVTSTHRAAFTAPGLSAADGGRVADALQGRLNSMLDLSMTLKHIHWNVVGPAFIGVHTMLDPQYAGVSRMTDALAERIATLGGVPNGLPGALVAARDWDDYELGRADTQAHLGALDLVYAGVIADHRAGDRRGRRHRSGVRRPADHPDRRAGGVPLVRPQPPGGLRRRVEHRRGEHRTGRSHRGAAPRAGSGEEAGGSQAPRRVGPPRADITGTRRPGCCTARRSGRRRPSGRRGCRPRRCGTRRARRSGRRPGPWRSGGRPAR